MKSMHPFKSYWGEAITKIKSKKGHNLAKILWMITNTELDLYFTMIFLLQTSNENNASLQKLLSKNQYQHNKI